MKRVKLSDIALKAGVSTATVSRVLNQSGYASPDVRDAVLEIAAELGYELPEVKKTKIDIKPRQTGFIGVILKKLPVNAFFEAFNKEMIQAAEKKGLLVSTVFCEHLNNETLAAQAKRMIEGGAYGLVVNGFEEGKLNASLKQYLLECGLPIIFVERLADSQGLNRVSVDNTLGGYLCGQYLASKGHKKIVYIERRSMDDYVDGGRLGGFMKAVQEAENPPECIVEYCDSPDPRDAYEAMKRAAARAGDFDAVQAWYDGYLIGIMQFLYETGRRVPTDVEVVGHDDTYAPLMSPPVSSVHMPVDKMADTAVSLISESLGELPAPVIRSVNMEPWLVIR